MSILRLSTLSLTVAIAVFALGYNPSFAGKPDSEGKHVHGDGKDKTETVFEVQMVQGKLDGTTPGLVTTRLACGSTEGELQLGVVFDANCAAIDVCFLDGGPGPTGCPLTLRLWYVQVNLNKSHVKIAFRPDLENNLYVTDHLPVTIIPDPVELSSSFTVEVNLPGLTVEKNHNPGKGTLAGPIAIGEIVYTLKPPPP